MEKSKIVALMFSAVSSITVLVMLTTSFTLFDKKYLPSFMLAQKYALPLIVSAMALMFVAFFEPERLHQHRSIMVMRITLLLTTVIFSYYLSTLNLSDTALATLIVFVTQWLVILFATIYFFTLKNTEAAG